MRPVERLKRKRKSEGNTVTTRKLEITVGDTSGTPGLSSNHLPTPLLLINNDDN